MSVNLRKKLTQILSAGVLNLFGVEGEPEYAQAGRVTPDGNLIVTPRDADDNSINGVTPSMDGQDASGADVTTVSEVVIPANPNRVALVMTNDSDAAIYVALGGSVAVNNGIRLNANGGSETLSKHGPLFTTEAIQAVHGGAGTKRLSFQEMQ